MPYTCSGSGTNQRCVITRNFSLACHVTSHRVFVWGYTAFDTLSTLFTLDEMKTQDKFSVLLVCILARLQCDYYNFYSGYSTSTNVVTCHRLQFR